MCSGYGRNGQHLGSHVTSHSPWKQQPRAQNPLPGTGFHGESCTCTKRGPKFRGFVSREQKSAQQPSCSGDGRLRVTPRGAAPPAPPGPFKRRPPPRARPAPAAPPRVTCARGGRRGPMAAAGAPRSSRAPPAPPRSAAGSSRRR